MGVALIMSRPFGNIGIKTDTFLRNIYVDAQNPDDQVKTVVQKRNKWFAQTIDYACKDTVSVQKWTDPGQCGDEFAGK